MLLLRSDNHFSYSTELLLTIAELWIGKNTQCSDWLGTKEMTTTSQYLKGSRLDCADEFVGIWSGLIRLLIAQRRLKPSWPSWANLACFDPQHI